ncbi:MAG: ABC transporter ATP-binding protein [Geminicoccaceae bacterium]|nr:ABC transporter ATP-binding protein [Geminicoccaceae bacterium]
MEPTIFGFIRRYSWRQQLIILGMTVLSFPFLYASLDLPKQIINDALGQADGGTVLGFQLDQLGYLFALCGIFLVLVLINGAFKYVINVYSGVVAERMLRRLRYMLYNHMLRFPLAHYRRMTQGELVQMINAEVEPLGGYVGDALSTPAFQGGTLVTILAFMFMQDPVLGLAAVALYPLQIYLIPKLQRQVNELGKRRVRQVRRLAERISETAQGVRDIRANDATQYQRAVFTRELGHVFDIRFEIYKKKFFIKFLNNFLAQLGPFFFFTIGGYLVIQGDLTIGALVAVVGAQKDLSSPWRELLAHYQLFMDVRIKYDQVIAQFSIPGLIDERRQDDDNPGDTPLTGAWHARGVTVIDEDDETNLESISFELDLPQHVAIVGPSGSGKEELCLVLANLIDPSRGRLLVNGTNLADLAESLTGRRIAYVGNPSAILAGTIRHNLLYGLMHRPMHDVVLDGETAAARERRYKENQLSGNSPYDSDADWIDYSPLGEAAENDDARRAAIAECLRVVGFDRDVYVMGLRSSIDETIDADLPQALLQARKAMQARLDEDSDLARLVERFDPERYNTNATVAENLLFGTPVGRTFDLDSLAEQPYVRAVLDKTGLTEELVAAGYKLAATMVEIFADLPPDHEYFRQFSFIDAEALPGYRALLNRADPSRLDQLGKDDRQLLLALPFKLIPARHRLGMVEDDLRQRLLEARRVFREELPASLEGAVAFFDPDAYNEAASIQDNILFGKIAYGQAQAESRIAALITEVLEGQGLIDRVVEVGLSSPAGYGGARLSPVQRQKLALARALMKRAEIYVFDDPLAPFDSREQALVRGALLEYLAGKSVFWALQNAEWARHFDHVLVLDQGRLVEHGAYEKLATRGHALHRLVSAHEESGSS